jgi:cytoskeletal protein RodZ
MTASKMNTTTDSEYAAILAQIGAKLRQTREEKSISLHQVNRQTLIPEHHLEAIEQGRLDALPELVYVQGFVRKYAQYLGLSELADELPSVSCLQSKWANSPSAKLDSWHLYFIYIAVVAGVVSALATAFSSNGYRFEELPSERTELQQKEIKAVPTTPAAKPVGQTLNLSVIMLGESWMRVTVDGKVQFEGILAEGRNLSWSGQKQIILRAGNGAAVSVSLNNSPSAVLGAEGEVVEKVYGSKSSSPRSIRD